MVLFLDFRDSSQAVAVLGKRGAQWLRRDGRRGEFDLLAEARDRFGLGREDGRPQAVVAAVWPRGAADVSWSAARTAVAVANSLAFAWGVPAVGLEIDGMSEGEIRSAVVAAVRSAAPGARLAVSYSGDPNISEPKRVF